MKRAKLGDTKWNSTILSSGHDETSDVPILSVQNLCADLDDDQKTVVSKIYLDGDDPAEVVVPKILTPTEISAMISAYIKSLGTIVYWRGDTGDGEGSDEDSGDETPTELTGQWLSVVDALETGNITNGVLNGITFGGKEVKIGNSLETDIAYYQGDDGNLISSSHWIVCGFNGAVPEYVKYKAGDMRYFVKSTDDSDNSERTIAVGDAVYTRTWNQSGLKYDYAKVGVIQSVEGEFKYGDTNTDYGTVSICNPYAVPTKLTIALDSGKTVEAEFAGHNMQLWSANMYLDCDAAGSYATAEAMMKDSNQFTTMAFGDSQNWSESYIRGFLNGDSRPSGCRLIDPNSWVVNKYTTQHSFIEKVSVNSDAMLQAVCSQVNRNWTPDAGMPDDGTIVRTTDRFWLPGCDLMHTQFVGDDSNADVKDRDTGLCKETEFANHVRPSFVNGSTGRGSYSYCWLRSAVDNFVNCFAALADGNACVFNYVYLYCGFAPACTIG